MLALLAVPARDPGRSRKQRQSDGKLGSGMKPHGDEGMAAPACTACELLAGVREVPGGLLHRAHGFALHTLADPSPIAGWLVLTSERHARAWYDLTVEESAAVGALARQVMGAQRAVLGAEHVYAFAIGDVLQHFHLHLVPRYAGTPDRLRGRRCFEGRPEDMLADAVLAEAGRRVAAALSAG